MTFCHDIFEVQLALLVPCNTYLPGTECCHAARQQVARKVVKKVGRKLLAASVSQDLLLLVSSSVCWCELQGQSHAVGNMQ